MPRALIAVLWAEACPYVCDARYMPQAFMSIMMKKKMRM